MTPCVPCYHLHTSRMATLTVDDIPAVYGDVSEIRKMSVSLEEGQAQDVQLPVRMVPEELPFSDSDVVHGWGGDSAHISPRQWRTMLKQCSCTTSASSGAVQLVSVTQAGIRLYHTQLCPVR